MSGNKNIQFKNKSIKEVLADHVLFLHNQLLQAQEDVLQKVKSMQASGVFFQPALESLQNAESAYQQLGWTHDFVKSDDYQGTESSQIRRILTERIEMLKLSEKNLFSNGLRSKNMVEASGIVQVRIAFEEILKSPD